MAVTLTVYEIFSVKIQRDLENWFRGSSRSLTTAPFDRSHTTFYRSAIVLITLSATVFELFDVGEVTQGHSNRYHSKACVQFPIRLQW